MSDGIDKMEAKISQAKSELALTGVLQTCTPQQAVDYIETNVNTLAQAKVAMKIMTRLIIILRDQIDFLK